MFYDGKLKTGAERGPPFLLNKYGLPTPILFGHVQGEEVSLVVSTEKGNENSVANTKEAEQAVSVILPSVHHGMMQTHKKTTAMSEFSKRSFIKLLLEC